MTNLVVIPPAIPGQQPWYYALYGFILSIMVIIMSIPKSSLPKKTGKVIYSIGCFLAIFLGVFCGYIVHIIAAIIAGLVLIAIAIYVYFKEVKK